MMRLIADFMMTRTMRARKAATTAPSRRTRSASIIRSSTTIQPSRHASIAGSIASIGLAVRGHVQEELAVALGAAQWRRRDSEDVPPTQHGVAGEPGHDLPVERGLTDQAAFADEVLTYLELWLDERDRFTTRREDVEDGGQHLFQRDERDVDDGQGRLVTEDARVERARVRLLHDDDARIAAQAGIELSGAHVDRIHARGATLEKTVGETAGGCADVDAQLADDVDVEVVEGVRQLLTAATHIGRPPTQLDFGFGGDEGAVFVDSLTVHEHVAGHDQFRGLLSAVHQSALDNHPIDPDAGGHRTSIIDDLGGEGAEQRGGPCRLGSPRYGQTRPHPPPRDQDRKS